MAKVLCRQTFPKERPFGFENCSEGAPTFVNEPALKRRRLMVQAKPKLARSSEVTSSTTVKRRKLAGKETVETVLDAWTKVFDQVDTMLPNVGKREIRRGSILQDLRLLMTDKHVQFAVACRGSSRTIAPPTNTAVGEAPLPKMCLSSTRSHQDFC